MKQFSSARLIAISSLGFATTLVANTLDPALYGHKILELAPHNPSTLLGFATAAGSILIIFLAPVVGALSDRHSSQLGRRLPFFLVGAPLMILALFGIGFAPSVLIFVAGVLLYRFGDNLIFTPWQALYPDHVPTQRRGLAAGVRSLMDILGVLIGRVVAGELLSRAPIWGEQATFATVAFPSTALLLACLATWAVVKNLPRGQPKAKRDPFWKTYRESFRFDWRRRKDFSWWLVNRFLFWTAFIILSTFLLLFVVRVVGLTEAEAQRYLARLSLVLGGAILLASLPAGRLADRFGRKPLVVISCGLAAVGTAIVVSLHSMEALTIAGAFIGIGAGIYLAANFAQLTDIVLAKETARYLGLSNIAGAAGGALARLLGGALIDPINQLSGSASTGYLSLYALAALLFAASAWAAWKMPEGGTAGG